MGKSLSKEMGTCHGYLPSIACAFSYLSIVAAVLIAVVESGEEGQIKKKWNVAILGIGALSIAHTIGLERTQGVIFASTSVVLLFLLYLIGKSRALRPAPSASPSV
ncbi:hypothetical protein HY771_00570 [Candidatus Uhrbacteria bacterium]|nr:hypothetical protein [Candidatus Uhrbacteria bacterium]